jgi:hypothetical protein
VPAIRVGITTFVKILGGKNGSAKNGNDDNTQEAAPVSGEELDGEELLKGLAHVKGDQSWNPLTKNDSKVRVRIF